MNTHLWVVAVVFSVVVIVAVVVWAVQLWRQLRRPDPWTGYRLLVDGQEYTIVSWKDGVVKVGRPFAQDVYRGVPVAVLDPPGRREVRRRKKCL